MYWAPDQYSEKICRKQDSLQHEHMIILINAASEEVISRVYKYECWSWLSSYVVFVSIVQL